MQRLTPTDVVGLASGVIAVAAGAWHTCALTTGGGVKCWDANGAGALGDGTTTRRETPTDVSGLTSGVAGVAGGSDHTCALATGGGVKCWGYNSAGQVGDGTTTNRTTPTDVTGLASGMAAVATGQDHTCALATGGGVTCWGRNSFGQLGDGTTTNRTTPADVTGLTSGMPGVVAGGSHTCAATTGGGMQCWGDNSHGQLGSAAFAPRLTPVPASGFGQIDFDWDDVADVAVYRPSTGTWFSLDSSTKHSTYRQMGWGMQPQGDTPAPGDYDGDGVVDPTVFRPGTGTWFILESHTGFTTWRCFGWGDAADTLMAGDYDGDGTTDAAVYRPSTGQWFVLPSGGASPWSLVFGQGADVPLVVR